METRAKMRSRGTVTITPYALSSFSISGGLFKDPGFGKESQTAKTVTQPAAATQDESVGTCLHDAIM
jgi:hypothetical protein